MVLLNACRSASINQTIRLCFLLHVLEVIGIQNKANPKASAATLLNAPVAKRVLHQTMNEMMNDGFYIVSRTLDVSMPVADKSTRYAISTSM